MPFLNTSYIDTDKGINTPNVLDGSKKENESVIHSGKSSHHHKETHGTSDDIDANTPIDEVKGPGVFQRAKEEVEALVEAVIHPKK